jgi:hypothetical protein
MVILVVRVHVRHEILVVQWIAQTRIGSIIVGKEIVAVLFFKIDNGVVVLCRHWNVIRGPTAVIGRRGIVRCRCPGIIVIAGRRRVQVIAKNLTHASVEILVVAKEQLADGTSAIVMDPTLMIIEYASRTSVPDIEHSILYSTNDCARNVRHSLDSTLSSLHF